MNNFEILDSLVDLSRALGQEDRNLAILGEGNSSANNGDGTFWVKASGQNLGSIGREGFCQIKFDPILDLLNQDSPSDDQVRSTLKAAIVDPGMPRPSVETFLHAAILAETGARFVGHTHPETVLSILCSHTGAELFMEPIFPETIVVCGSKPAVVPYVTPGFPLGAAIQRSLREFFANNGKPPKMVLLVNHGLVALGQTPQEVLGISLLAEKWARILVGASSVGGVKPLTADQARDFEAFLGG